jgi:hypothetical protein
VENSHLLRNAAVAHQLPHPNPRSIDVLSATALSCFARTALYPTILIIHSIRSRYAHDFTSLLLNDAHGRFQMWSDNHFVRVTLKTLGLRVQLGHAVGKACMLPIPVRGDNFVVIDIGGIHDVALDFCGCQTAQPPTVQLLRYRWFPSTVNSPRTAATFNVLSMFQLLSFESKASAFEYYYTLARRTDNTGVNVLKVSQVNLSHWSLC